MSRPRDPDRLRTLVQAASTVFLSHGYRLAQVADVARAMGVAPGTIYLYVESKEALFDLAIRAAIAPGLVDEDRRLPVSTPERSSTLRFMAATLEAEARFPELERAVQSPGRDARRELESVVRELYRKTAKHWLALKLMERCAADWPELAELWFGRHRLRLFQQLAQYLGRRMAGGRLRKVRDPVLAARLILEMIAAFAMHCRTDAHAPAMDQALAETTVVDAVVHAYGLGRR